MFFLLTCPTPHTAFALKRELRMVLDATLAAVIQHVPPSARVDALLDILNKLQEEPSPANARTASSVLLLLKQQDNVDAKVLTECRLSVVRYFIRLARSDLRLIAVVEALELDPQLLNDYVLTLLAALEQSLGLSGHERTTASVTDDQYFRNEVRKRFEEATLVQHETPPPTVCFEFFKALFWTSCYQLICYNKKFLVFLISLIAHTDSAIGALASQSVHAYVVRSDPLSHVIDPQNLSIDIWSVLSNSFGSQVFPFLSSTLCLSVWLRLLSLETWRDITCTWISIPSYFVILQEVLGSGSPEQQKIALSIFKLSIDFKSSYPKPEDAQRQGKRAQYARWAATYEAIVLVRYMNQIQECLPELSALATADSSVEPVWLLVLLRAAFQPRFQDGHRALIASWALHSPQDLLIRAGTDGADFLGRSFLPWAATGSLYVSSMIVDWDLKSICQHGEDVSRFVAHTVQRAAETDISYSIIVSAILRFLSEQRRHISPDARTYIIEGLLAGIRAGALSLTENCYDLLEQVASTTGFIEISQQYMNAMLAEIARLSRQSSYTEGVSPEWPGVSTDAADVKNESATSQVKVSSTQSHDRMKSVQGPSIDQIFSEMTLSRHKSLAGDGLVVTCSKLEASLESCSEHDQLDTTQLRSIYQAMWDEAGIQGYPRETLIVLPRLILHRRVLPVITENIGVFETSSRILNELKDLSTYRIYAFSALIAAWHGALLLSQEKTYILPLSDLLFMLATTVPSAKVEFEMEAIFARKLSHMVADVSYERYYRRPQAVAYAYALSLVARLPPTSMYLEMSRDVLDRLLTPWINLKIFTAVHVPWKSTVQLQVLLILNERVAKDIEEDEPLGYLNKYLYILSLEQNPRYRFLLEWMIARLSYHHKHLRWKILNRQADADISNPKFAVSIIKLTLILAQLPDTNESFATELSTQLIVLAASIRVTVRHEAHWRIPKLWDLAVTRGWQSVTNNEAFKRLNVWIRSLDIFKEPPAWRHLDDFDAVRDHNLTFLVSGKYLEMEPRELPKCRYEDFVRVEQESREAGLTPLELVIPLGDPPTTSRPTNPQPLPTYLSDTTPPSQLTHPTTLTPLQTKSQPLPLPKPNPLTTRLTPLIIIASLVTSATNLGGLSRMSEVLGASTLYISDLAHTSKKDFTSLAVSSHLHLPIEPLPIPAITEFLIAKKVEGYEVVGVEQTDSSRVLGDLKEAGARGERKEARFREDGKTVLLLGSEREGIPGTLLAECDWCVEIRQRGVTRSMNVQTAAGVVCWEWGRQWEEAQKRRGVGV